MGKRTVWSLCLLLTAAAAVGQEEPRSVVISAGMAKAGKAKIYWADHAGNAIRRSNTDGTGVEVLAASVDGPYGISYDPATGYLIWTSEGDETVQATPADGSGGVITLESSFEDNFAVVVNETDHQIAYGVVDGQVIKVTLHRTTGEEQREVLHVLPSPDAVHGLALTPDRTALYMGDSVGRMSQKLSFWNRCVEPLLYVDSPPTASAAAMAKLRPAPCPSLRPEVAQ